MAWQPASGSVSCIVQYLLLWSSRPCCRHAALSIGVLHISVEHVSEESHHILPSTYQPLENAKTFTCIQDCRICKCNKCLSVRPMAVRPNTSAGTWAGISRGAGKVTP